MPNPDISILIATFNRAALLRQTLDALAGLARGALAVEVVVIDNNSTDDTRAAVESFQGRLPVRYLFEPRSGKNIALNRALGEAGLGPIVVFTDDDVLPVKDWLIEIVAACGRWPGHSVFGGPIEVVWPGGKPPPWAGLEWMRIFVGAEHQRGPQEKPYPPGELPCGANLWFRRGIFDSGRRYDESIGPRATRRIMGSETSLLKQLVGEGFEIVYCPKTTVGHCVQSDRMTPAGLRAKALWYGRSFPRLGGLPLRDLFDRHPHLWRLRRMGSALRLGLQFCVAMLSLSESRRMERTLSAVRSLGAVLESLVMAREMRAARATKKPGA